ncbi:PREDICTED: 8-oxo-dGDP phosphatase NUDT18 isoform X2 [Dinoponera quadriceps]|uniref:8-oxo-dGDP phosphatase NUDT18 isoform X2 n=1 Tax=Dinoponera quadriceps TaxID=609295 RepID=A0A6P3XT33_DINQU|nr:PREDICTED: 8-oxo-dGDP phosphatase NUDT18 isoform X2 [Dinoponera quadriceps]
MSDFIENQVQSLLAGQALEPDDTHNVHVLADDTAGAKSGQLTSYIPVCLKTVTYIVAAVVINDQGEMLMIQEAKASCNGKWYLPAGRVEKNEDLLSAVKREVLEETGLVLAPTTLILVECANGTWFRFVFTGDIVGGTLKTPDQANEESLQACWVRNINDLPLRSNDIIYLLERGKSYVLNKTVSQHPHLMPVIKPHSKLLLRLTVTSKKRATLHVLLSDTEQYELPICEINPNRSLLSTLHSFMTEIFGNDVAQHKPHGLLSVEFSSGQGGDGLCLTLLVSFKLPLEDVPIIGKYIWHELSENVAGTLEARLPRNMTVPLKVVR